MAEGFGFLGMLREDTESLLLVPCRAHHTKDPQDLTSMPWDNMCMSSPCFGNT